MRDVILGGSAKIWQAIAREPGIAPRFTQSLSHAGLAHFAFTPQDRVWVFAYSRLAEDNRRMLAHLAQAGVAEIVYISSSSTIIAGITSCYDYPRAKKQAEDDARLLPQARILTLGLVVNAPEELPAGRNAATTIADIARFMLAPRWPDEQGRGKHLLTLVDRPMRGPLESLCYRGYGQLMRWSGRHPCLLRPLDFALRGLGMRWYGYTYLSNLLWSRSMTS
jgi:hypothetical protein